MKMQLRMRKLRLIFVIFEILFKKLKVKLPYAIQMQNVSNVFLFTFQIPQRLLMHLNAKFLSMLGESNYIK